MLEGIDVFKDYQTITDWQAVKNAGISWCYHKVSDGIGTRPVNDIAGGKRVGILQGGYHFSQPGNAVAQAQLLTNQNKQYGTTDLAYALDLEDNPAGSFKANIPDKDKAAFAIAFGFEIERLGNRFALYANDFTMSFIQSSVRNLLPDTHFWVARYGAPPKNPYDSWQYSSTGHIPGITASSVDRNKGLIPTNGVDMFDDNDKATLDLIKRVVAVRYPSEIDPSASYDTGEFVRFIDTATNKTREKADILDKKLDELTAKVNTLTTPPAPSVDLDALADKVVARLSVLQFKSN